VKDKPDKSDRSKRVAKRWIRNASDERAVREGYWFDQARADFAVEWMHEHCHLYEGEHAGERMELRDWQLDFALRLFGWVHYSDRWGRVVRRFRKASGWVPKKNKKSPTLAGCGLYLFCGDGELGQKCFSTAKDGKQAMISHRHAMEMVKMSPLLDAECTVNEGTGRIVHGETRSFYTVLSGDNREGQEGINGSILVDETHVVDRRLMSVIKRAGISRSEPLHIELSTAGNNPDGYGKERWERGERVARDEITDLEYLHVSYHAPQDTQPEALRDEPTLIRLGKLANPAWGHTIDEAEFKGDYQESSSSVSATREFMMYRLNVWQYSVNPWLSLDAWKSGERSFSLDDMHGRECWAGLDLASVRDLNALSLIFPESDGRYRGLWWFWLPEETARATKHLVPWFEWAEDPRCNLVLTKGSAVNHEQIRKEFREICGVVSVNELAFDPYNAEETTRTMSEGQAIDGDTLEEGTGVPRYEFVQAVTRFSEATKLFESLVLGGKLEHNGDPCITWQVGHSAVRSDANGNVKPVKPGGKDDIRKVDGLIAGVMALDRAAAASGQASIYDDPDEGEVLF
jgi:phage terminase large subunit-like protein